METPCGYSGNAWFRRLQKEGPEALFHYRQELQKGANLAIENKEVKEAILRGRRVGFRKWSSKRVKKTKDLYRSKIQNQAFYWGYRGKLTLDYVHDTKSALFRFAGVIPIDPPC